MCSHWTLLRLETTFSCNCIDDLLKHLAFTTELCAKFTDSSHCNQLPFSKLRQLWKHDTPDGTPPKHTLLTRCCRLSKLFTISNKLARGMPLWPRQDHACVKIMNQELKRIPFWSQNKPGRWNVVSFSHHLVN